MWEIIAWRADECTLDWYQYEGEGRLFGLEWKHLKEGWEKKIVRSLCHLDDVKNFFHFLYIRSILSDVRTKFFEQRCILRKKGEREKSAEPGGLYEYVRKLVIQFQTASKDNTNFWCYLVESLPSCTFAFYFSFSFCFKKQFNKI